MIARTPLQMLRHHVTGAIERGEATAIRAQERPLRCPYLTATVTPNGNLKLTADNAARAWLKEQQGRTDMDLLWDGLEGYWSNGSFEPFSAGDGNPFVGLSCAPCIAESVDVDDDGKKTIHGRFWYHGDYMIRSFAEQLKNRGFVYFHAP